MKYSAWIDFPSFSIAIAQTGESFRCIKFVQNQMVRGALKECTSPGEVKHFLLSLPHPPKEQIEIAVAALELVAE